MLIALIFAHLVDIHIPTSQDFLHEYEMENDRANKEAEETMSDPDASDQDRADAIDQLFGPKGNYAWKVLQTEALPKRCSHIKATV